MSEAPVTKTLEEISYALLQGDVKSAAPVFDEVLSLELPNEDKLVIFQTFPRRLTSKHLQKFLAAEKPEEPIVSQALVQSNFADVDRDVKLAVLPTVVSRLEKVEATAAQVYACHLELVAAAPSGAAADDHAVAAIKYAVKTKTFFEFEALIDTLKRVKFVATKPTTAELVKALEEICVGGGGVDALNKVKPKLDKAFVDEFGAALLRKAQLLSLPKLISAGTVVQLAKLTASLGVASAEEVQQILVDGHLAGVVRVRVNLEKQEAEVLSTMALSFDADAWKKLQKDLDSWQKRVDDFIKAYDSA